MSLDSPVMIPFDSRGIELSVTGGVTLPVSTSANIIAGVDDSTIVRYFRMASTGELYVTGALSVTGSQTVNQGNAGSQAQSWFVKLSDGTNVLGTGSSSPLWISGAVTVNGTVTANQGTAGTQAQSWFVKISDGTNVLGTGSSSPLYVTGTVAANITGTVVVRNESNATSTRTNVSQSATTVILLSSSLGRRGASLYNDSVAGTSGKLFVNFAATSFTTNFTVAMAGGSYYEVPAWYTGVVSGIWGGAGSGLARMTEISL